MGGGLSVLTSLPVESLPETDPAICKHLFCEKWGPNHFHCADCHGTLEDPDHIAEEERIIESIVDESVPEDGVYRGVTIQFLVDFATACNCWDMTTREVRRRFVMPATRSSRCRFVELPEMADVVGKAQTFVSHTWGAKFGDLVAAVCDGGADRSRRVWVDIFAVRQWPSRKPDLDFSAVVRQCSSFVIVCSSFSETFSFSFEDSTTGVVEIPPHIRVQIAFLRVWCLVELHAAIVSDVAIVLKVGSCRMVTDCVTFRPDLNAFDALFTLINIEAAEATVASDKERILNDIRLADGGVNAVSEIIRGVVVGSIMAAEHPAIQCAACGDMRALSELLSEPSKFIGAVSGCGYVNLLQKLIDAGGDINKTDDEGRSPIALAVAGGHLSSLKLLVDSGADTNCSKPLIITAMIGGNVECVKYLISKGADVNCQFDGLTVLMNAVMFQRPDCVEVLIECGAAIDATNDEGLVPLMFAALSGHVPCLELLMKKGCKVDIQSNDGSTALILAVLARHVPCVELLLSKGCNMDLQNNSGMSALMVAAYCGHASCVKLLLKKGCDAGLRCKEGRTALMFAEQDGKEACAALLR